MSELITYSIETSLTLTFVTENCDRILIPVNHTWLLRITTSFKFFKGSVAAEDLGGQAPILITVFFCLRFRTPRDFPNMAFYGSKLCLDISIRNKHGLNRVSILHFRPCQDDIRAQKRRCGEQRLQDDYSNRRSDISIINSNSIHYDGPDDADA